MPSVLATTPFTFFINSDGGMADIAVSIDPAAEMLLVPVFGRSGSGTLEMTVQIVGGPSLSMVPGSFGEHPVYWYVEAPPTGAQTLRFTLDAGGQAIVEGGAASVDDIFAGDPFRTLIHSDSPGAEASHSADVESAVGDLVFFIAGISGVDGTADPLTPGAGQTEIFDSGQGNFRAACSTKAAAAGLTTMSYAHSEDPDVIGLHTAGIAVKPATPPAPPPTMAVPVAIVLTPDQSKEVHIQV